MLNLTFAEGFRTLRHELWKRTSDIWISLYDNIPDGLFAGSSKTESQNTNKVVSQRVCIVLGDVVDYPHPRLHSSAFLRWNRNYRPYVFSSLTYGTRFLPTEAVWSALGSSTAVSIYTKLQKIEGVQIAQLVATGGPEFLHLGATPRYFISAVPEQLNRSGLIEIRFKDSQTRKVVECVLNSILFYWYWRTTGDGFHLTKSTIFDFPIPYSLLSDNEGVSMMAQSLEAVREQCRTSKLNNGIIVYNVNYNLSPQILARIEQFLRQHYTLSDKEADFLTNYEAKYRLIGDPAIIESTSI